MWRSFLTASLGLGAVWIGLINLADAAAMPISRGVKQNAVQRLVSGLALSGSNAQEAIQALNVHPDLLCDGNDNNTCTASTPSPNSNSYIAAEKAKSRAALACHIARLVFDGNGQYVDASFDGPYLNKTEVNWSSTCWLSAQCFVTPSSASEVGLALEIVTFLHAKFAVRAGGHNPNPGFSSISDYGLLIDLSALTNLELSPDKKVVGVGPGNRWYNVYKYLDQSGVTVVGGRVPEVGVGGLMLGGGLSHFSSEYGLACDNVRNFEVVLANSSIVNANAQENSDLFFALKGGGPNFGVVTRFDLYTVQHNPTNQVWFEVRVFQSSENENLLRALVDYEAAAAKDSKAGITFSLSLNLSAVGFIYSAPTPRPDVFKSFYSIPSVATQAPSTIGTQAQLALVFTSAGPAAKYDIISQATGVSIDLYLDAYRRYVEIASNLYNSTGAILTFGLQPITKEAVLQGQRKGGNPLGLSAQEQQWFDSTVTWNDETHTNAAHQAVTSMGKVVEELAQAKGVDLPFIFQNDANHDQSPLRTYPAENLAKLKAASLKYDPKQVFQTLQGDGFLLSKT